MAYTNEVTEITIAIIVVIMFLGMANEVQSFQELDTVCVLRIPEIFSHCYIKMNVSSSPSEKCCADLKNANEKEVTCLCDKLIANPMNSNSTRALYDKVSTACDVVDKFACNGAHQGGAATIKNGATKSLIGLVAFLVLLLC